MATNKVDEEAADWGASLDGQKAPGVGVDRDMLRKALALNPKLRSSVKTNDVMAELKQANRERSVTESKEEAPPRAGPVDVADQLLQIKERFAEDLRRTKEEIAKLQAMERSLVPKTRDRLIDVILQGDPNLTSPKIQALLVREKVFLSSVGFSMDALLDRQAKNKKR